MEARTSIFSALGLLAGMAGCQHTAPQPVASLPPGAILKKESDEPKQLPKPSTCVAYGDFRAAEANGEPSSPMTDQMREQARIAYAQALDLDPKNLKALQGMARLQVAAGDRDEGIATLKKAIAIYPKEASLWHDLGMVHSRKKEWDMALNALGKAAELAPRNRTYVNMYGYALARVGRYDESLACFARLSGEAKAHYNLARMLQHLGQQDAAKMHLELAVQIDPNLDAAKQLLADMDKPSTPKAQAPAKLDGTAQAQFEHLTVPQVNKPATLPAVADISPGDADADAEKSAAVQPAAATSAGPSIMLPRPPLAFGDLASLADPAPKQSVSVAGSAKPSPE